MRESTSVVFDEPQTLRPARVSTPRQAADWDNFQQTSRPKPTADLFLTTFVFQARLYEQVRSKEYFERQLTLLQQSYIILDSNDSIIEILREEPALAPLLIEAVTPLKKAFGERRIQLRSQAADDDTFLKVAVQLPVDFPDPENALLSFDSAWWLNNCHRSSGALVFDYEIQDAV